MQIDWTDLRESLQLQQALREIRAYIKQTWQTLTRSNATLLASALDVKVEAADRFVLYIARDEAPDRIAADLEAQLGPARFARVELHQLPADPQTIDEHGLLYLPHPYVVPGGRFNEMYGWDSYFTLLGLARDGELQLAKNMTDNCIYEIEHYGMILNANRTYFLTRSQPPFLTQMILEVFRRTGNTAWLASTLPAIEKYYDFWTREPYLTPQTGLSRYNGGANTPAPEVVQGEVDAEGKNHYDRVREYFRAHADIEADLARYYDPKRDVLTPHFYQSDRAMRESGFDPSWRFGPFSADTIRYNPVCLNSLLCLMEMDAAAILSLLDQPWQANVWAQRAQWRARQINRLMWNESAGLYFDYHFEAQQQSDFAFLTTFYPLWAGIASEARAGAVAAHLPVFERAWGLQTSDRKTGCQWDGFGWAPMHIMAVQGLRRYDLHEDADRISLKFLALVLRDFGEHGVIKEKYDVEAGKSDIAEGVRYGYTSNEVGFGWTNAAFVLLYEELAASTNGQRINE
jgi:alpha,alpha-trehalase